MNAKASLAIYRFGVLSVPLLLALLVAVLPAHSDAQPTAGTTLSQNSTPECKNAAADLERGELEDARETYLEALANESSRDCAVAGLRAIARRGRVEGTLCAEGKALAAAGEAKAALRRYTAILQINGDSKCAKEGLTTEAKPKEEAKEDKGWLEKAAEKAVNLLKLLGSLAIAALVVIGIVLIVIMLWRRRKPSLSIEAFADGAVEPKAGAAVTGLVEKQLSDLARKGGGSDAYTLDLIVSDVELVATNKGLETALGSLAEQSQLALLVAVLSLADRMFGTHLVAKGELAPRGTKAYGVVLALQSERTGLQAMGVLWNPRRPVKDNPQPFYELAEPAAAWIQYETARSLDSRLGMITTSPKSFSILSVGLEEHRKGNLEAAATAYSEALMIDPENVAAMFNLGLILARSKKWFLQGFWLRARARMILENRYEEQP